MTRPIIGIAGFVKPISIGPDLREPALVAPMRYVEAVARAGGVPVVLGYAGPADVLDRLDGLVLMGGGDVDPRRYGADAHPATSGVDPDRDEAEAGLVLAAVDRATPTLCICRGAQVLNVALGGTLLQHLDGHRNRPGVGILHEVRAEPGSRVAEACGARFQAWSSHHQAVDRLAPGLVAIAWAPDGTLEAAELPDGWVLAVQWHPEQTAATDARQLALFEALVREAGRAVRRPD